ncbi:hypothetical protein [Paracoccus sp. (in: a-proteobacteria)]|uniref:hypothetical protein n=1 Tax=Paracoccus sp. TaxID=267 RepID=UPI003A88D00C
MMKIYPALLLVCSGLALTSCASTRISAADCETAGIHAGKGEPENLKNGFVGQHWGFNFPGSTSATGYNVTYCPTEASLRLYSSQSEDIPDASGSWQTVSEPERREQVEDIRQQLLTSKTISLEEIAELAARADVKTGMSQSGEKQSCGCAAFYPDARGEKSAYDLSEQFVM